VWAPPVAALVGGPGGRPSARLETRSSYTGALEGGTAAELREPPTSGTVGASVYGRGERGRTRFVVDIDRDVLIGAAFVGPEVADLLHAATIAIVAQVQLGLLAHPVPSFPRAAGRG
jgi:pyruvate/2-oxoglutarate dehydrogenase complex dihydrolipoamide dehydrogenase (E3) component